MHLPVGITLQGGKYEIISYISSGGFGCTYKARHAMLNTTVAIKEFFVKDYCNRDASTYSISVATQSKAELIERLSRKFIEEARAIFNMNHPNIVRVTDIFEENGTVYYVMDYIEGCSFASFIADRGRLSEKEALGFICQVADALGYVHSCNRLHLDVKPQNIMIDKSGKAILIDFGVSKQYDEVNGENTSTLLGCTPGYAPIEQSGNGVLRFYPSADIYALGATLYKALSGVTPVAAHLRASGEELDPLPADITPATCEAVEAAMKINKAHRPQSVAEFLKLLENGGKSKDERAESKDETILNSSSTPGGEVSLSDGGESELSTVNTENAKNYTASPEDEETQVGMNPPRPSATPPFEKVGELSNVDSDDDETLLNSSSTLGGEVSLSDGGENELSTVNIENAKNYTTSSGNEETLLGSENGVDDATLHTESVSVLQIDKPSFKKENKKNKSIKKLWIIPLLLLIAGGCAWFLFGGTEDQAYIPVAAEYEQKVAEYEPETLSSAAGYENSYECVDLGLSVKWATYNVGANSPEEYGNLYYWDESQQLGTGNWRLPTKGELKVLRDKCSWEWTTEKGVYGYQVTGPNGNSIFLPAAGCRDRSGDVNAVGSRGFYWSSSSYDPEKVFLLGFYADNVYMDCNYKNFGFSVRLVQDSRVEPEALSPATGYENGYGYVDLGLSVKWAMCNVGASSPEEYGGYYAWGETEEKRNYDWSTYKWCNGSDDTMTKYCTESYYNSTVDNKTVLDPQDDVAHVKWGGSWRMPTLEEQKELLYSCTWTWTTQNGVNGYEVTGPNGNSIFLPAAGLRSSTDLGGSGSCGFYRSSSLYEDHGGYAYLLAFYGDSQGWCHYGRYDGRSVRPVSE